MVAASSSEPTTTRSGFKKSFMASPSFKNSGLETTWNSISTFLFFNSSDIVCFTLSAVPTGTVDLSTTIRGVDICSPISLATCRTYLRSAEPSSPIGVPTAIKATSQFSRLSFKLVLKSKVLLSIFLFTIGSKPGS